jgi:N-acetylglutamate synthase-like GNAT family acetyltransferase
MNVRQANKWDIPQLIQMLKNYRMAAPWDRLKNCDNEDHVNSLLTRCLVAGAIFVAEKDEKLVGMLVAIKNSNVWDPDLFVVNELAYWVEPEYRGSSAGYKLITRYKNYCDQEKSLGHIEAYTISKMINSPDLDYGRFGFNKLEEQWSIT